MEEKIQKKNKFTADDRVVKFIKKINKIHYLKHGELEEILNINQFWKR